MAVGSRGGKVPVTARALTKRINRKRASAGNGHLVVKKHRLTGAYYTLDTKRNIVADPHVDLEALGRTLKVLEPYETLDRETM